MQKYKTTIFQGFQEEKSFKICEGGGINNEN